MKYKEIMYVVLRNNTALFPLRHYLDNFVIYTKTVDTKQMFEAFS